VNDYLLDTHVFLWYAEGNPRLSEVAKSAIEEGRKIYVSVVSPWELAIKSAKGSLKLDRSIAQMCGGLEEMGFSLLPVELAHVLTLSGMPAGEVKDPFDRMLSAQAASEGVGFISADHRLDPLLQVMGVRRVW
jgi:PIN domain nuclease of toxin-antitoxin system